MLVPVDNNLVIYLIGMQLSNSFLIVVAVCIIAALYFECVHAPNGSELLEMLIFIIGFTLAIISATVIIIVNTFSIKD
jgi:preprotein translocase subunit SecE